MSSIPTSPRAVVTRKLAKWIEPRSSFLLLIGAEGRQRVKVSSPTTTARRAQSDSCSDAAASATGDSPPWDRALEKAPCAGPIGGPGAFEAAHERTTVEASTRSGARMGADYHRTESTDEADGTIVHEGELASAGAGQGRPRALRGALTARRGRWILGSWQRSPAGAPGGEGRDPRVARIDALRGSRRLVCSSVGPCSVHCRSSGCRRGASRRADQRYRAARLRRTSRSAATTAGSSRSTLSWRRGPPSSSSIEATGERSAVPSSVSWKSLCPSSTSAGSASLR